MLKGRTVCPEVSLTISPGSRQVLAMLSANGSLTDLLNAGARVLEATCGPCIGMGQSPNSGGASRCARSTGISKGAAARATRVCIW